MSLRVSRNKTGHDSNASHKNAYEQCFYRESKFISGHESTIAMPLKKSKHKTGHDSNASYTNGHDSNASES